VWPRDRLGIPLHADPTGAPIWPDQQSRQAWEAWRAQGFPAFPPPVAAAPVPPPVNRKNPAGFASTLALVIVGVIVYFVIHAISSSPSASDKTKLMQDNAYEACKHFVSEQLKAPATASYPNFFTNTTDIQLTDNHDGSYEILSQVDSENGFGAKLRSYFDCKVSTADGGNNWTDEGTTVTDGGATS
jgi:hypothetical protein